MALSLGTMVAGALVTEMVFSYPGIGSLLFTAIRQSDYPLIQGITLLVSVAVLLATSWRTSSTGWWTPVSGPPSEVSGDGGDRADALSSALHPELGPPPRGGGPGAPGAVGELPRSPAHVGWHVRGPIREHWLGTDNFGRDVFTQLLYGTRTSLYVGAIAGLVATAIGVAVGALAGYRGGWLDEMLMGLTNVFITIPSIVILILVSVSLRTRTATIMGLVIGLTSWPWTARVVRAQTTSLKTREHMDVARLSGLSTPRIILFEILPFMFSYIFMAFILQFFGGLMSEATLSMLGLGPFQTVSLGVMLQWALLWEAVSGGLVGVPAARLLPHRHLLQPDEPERQHGRVLQPPGPGPLGPCRGPGRGAAPGGGASRRGR